MIEYQTHVSNLGWLPVVKDGSKSGTVGQSLRVEALRINNVDIPEVGVQGFAYIQDHG